MATMTPATTAPCPICKKAVPAAVGARAETFPFCGERCRKIDLGQWLGEGYRIPTEDASVGDDDLPDGEPDKKS